MEMQMRNIRIHIIGVNKCKGTFETLFQSAQRRVRERSVQASSKNTLMMKKKERSG
jgi:hypothetical protein